MVEKVYEKGLKIAEECMKMLNIEKHETIPNWNHTIRPQPRDLAGMAT